MLFLSTVNNKVKKWEKQPARKKILMTMKIQNTNVKNVAQSKKGRKSV